MTYIIRPYISSVTNHILTYLIACNLFIYLLPPLSLLIDCVSWELLFIIYLISYEYLGI